MKKFVITSLKACNIANLDSVSFATLGDVLVTGMNGSGKSTIKNAILWCLNGTTADGEKLQNGETNPTVAIELSDGEKFCDLKKMQVRKGFSVTNECYLNGIPVRQKEIEQYFMKWVPAGMLKVMLELGNFFSLKAAEQREILTEYFSDKRAVEGLDEKLNGLDTKDLTVEGHVAAVKTEIRRLKMEQQSLPKMIDELEKQFTEEEIPDDIDYLQEENKKLSEQIQALQTGRGRVDSEIHLVDEKIKRMTAELNKASADMAQCLEKVDELRQKWKNASAKCPLCGKGLSREDSNAVRAKIADEGKRYSLNADEFKAQCAKIESRLNELYSEKARLMKSRLQDTELNTLIKRREGVQERLCERRAQIKQRELNKKNLRRIEELRQREKAVGRRMVECEHQLALAEEYTQKKMELITESINANFEHIKFQMFETLKNGEIRSICEATLNGVSYDKLSKGEKLKAALDFLNALQKKFGVMMPLLIDDAESYTSNSLIEVENQKILFKVVEGQDLLISC